MRCSAVPSSTLLVYSERALRVSCQDIGVHVSQLLPRRKNIYIFELDRTLTLTRRRVACFGVWVIREVVSRAGRVLEKLGSPSQHDVTLQIVRDQVSRKVNSVAA